MLTSTGTGPEYASLTATEIAAVRAIARLARFAERELGELSLAPYRVLSAIASGDERASRVAAKFSLGKPAISATVDALCRRGLVRRSASGNDQRASTLALTAEGQLLLDVAERSLVTGLRKLGSHTGDSAQVIDALASLGVALEIAARTHSTGSRTNGTNGSRN